MNMQLRTILLGLLSIGFVQGYAQTFALQVNNEGITYLNDERGNRILDFSVEPYCWIVENSAYPGNFVFPRPALFCVVWIEKKLFC